MSAHHVLGALAQLRGKTNVTTPSPESALAEWLESFDRASSNSDYVRVFQAAYEILSTHAAHFAALASELSRMQDMDAGMREALLRANARAERAEAERDALRRGIERAEDGARKAEAELEKERKLSAAISRDCNECANQRNKAIAERDAAVRGGRARSEAFNLADTVIEHMQCGREQEARKAIMEAFRNVD